MAVDHRVLGVCIVGSGYAARTIHAPLLLSCPELHLVGFVSRQNDRSLSGFGSARIWQTLEQALADPEIELVVLATPNSSHERLAVQALSAGKHVLVEKPLAVTSDEVERIASAAKRNRRLVFTFHNRRLDGDFLAVQKLVASKKLGRLVEAAFRWERWAPSLRPKPWKEAGTPGSELLDDIGAHLVDQALQLFGEPGGQSKARQYCQREHSQVHDAFALTLEYDWGPLTLSAGMLCAQPLPRWLLRGQAGSYTTFGFDPQEAQLKAGLLPGNAAWGCVAEAEQGIVTLDGPSGLYSERWPTPPGRWQDFYPGLAATLRGEPAPAFLCNIDQAGSVVRLIEQARASQ